MGLVFCTCIHRYALYKTLLIDWITSAPAHKVMHVTGFTQVTRTQHKIEQTRQQEESGDWFAGRHICIYMLLTSPPIYPSEIELLPL